MRGNNRRKTALTVLSRPCTQLTTGLAWSELPALQSNARSWDQLTKPLLSVILSISSTPRLIARSSQKKSKRDQDVPVLLLDWFLNVIPFLRSLKFLLILRAVVLVPGFSDSKHGNSRPGRVLGPVTTTVPTPPPVLSQSSSAWARLLKLGQEWPLTRKGMRACWQFTALVREGDERLCRPN